MPPTQPTRDFQLNIALFTQENQHTHSVSPHKIYRHVKGIFWSLSNSTCKVPIYLPNGSVLKLFRSYYTREQCQLSGTPQAPNLHNLSFNIVFYYDLFIYILLV